MNNADYNEIVEILSDLLNELVSEEEKLTEIVNEHTYRIEELNQQIDTCRKNEDIDFRVFSPRNISYDNSEKISALETERTSCERDKSEATKRLGYYSGKAEKIKKVLSLLKSSEYSYSGSSDIEKPIKSTDPFDYLLNRDQAEEVEVSKNNIEDLFKPDKKTKDEEVIKKDADILEDIINDTEIEEAQEEKEIINITGIPVDDVQRVCHKVEFTEKIINNDRVRAKIELKDVVNDLKELIRVYS